MSPDKIYRPERSDDLPMFKALAQIINEPESITGGSSGGFTVGEYTTYIFDYDVTGNITVSPVDLFTASGNNAHSQVYEVVIFSENLDLTMVGGSLVLQINWSRDDNADLKTNNNGPNQSLDGLSGQLYSSFGVYQIQVDTNTTVTWEWSVSSVTSGTTRIRIVFAVRRLI
jgi:hypothetical protein